MYINRYQLSVYKIFATEHHNPVTSAERIHISSTVIPIYICCFCPLPFRFQSLGVSRHRPVRLSSSVAKVSHSGYQPYSSLATSTCMGGCPSRITCLAYKPLWGLSGVRPGFRARSRWKWAIRVVVRRIKLRRLIAIAFQNLAGESHLFDHLRRQQGRLERRTEAPQIGDAPRTVEPSIVRSTPGGPPPGAIQRKYQPGRAHSLRAVW